MSIRYRPDREKWELAIVVEGKRKRLLFDTKSEASSYCVDGRRGQTFSDTSSITIEDAIKIYSRDVSSAKTSTSRKNERLYFNLMYHFLTGKKLEQLHEIKYGHMLALQNWLLTPKTLDEKSYKWSNATVNRAFNSIKDFFVFFVRDGKIPSSPCTHLAQLQCEDNSRRPMTFSDFKLAFEKAPHWFRPTMLFIRLTASAPSSVARLKWDDVNFEDREIVITRRKGAKGKWRRIHQPMTDELYELLKSQPLAHSHVFSNEHGEPLSADWCSDVGNRAIRAAGLAPDMVLYCIRHSLASDLTDANVSLEVVRQLMGHSNIRTTQGYAKPKTETLASALKLVRGKEMPPRCHQGKEAVASGGK
jgi:site-specific recombinase XerD